MNLSSNQYQTQLEMERLVLNKRIQNFGTQSNSDSGWADTSALQNAHTTLNRIEQAQVRMTQGQYGRCQSCQEPINPDRLAIIPYAEYCIQCQTQIERTHLKGVRLYA